MKSWIWINKHMLGGGRQCKMKGGITLKLRESKIFGKKLTALLLAGGIMMAGQIADAKAITTPGGGQPVVHWAVLQAKHGTMSEMTKMAIRNVAPYLEKEQ